MRFKVLYITLFICSSFQIWAQDKIDPTKFNEDLLKNLINQEVNNLRTRKRLDSLTMDPSLDKASQDHAQYMGENKVLTHVQKKKYKRTPFDRVVYFGGTHDKVAENVQMQPIKQLFDDSNGKLTYQKLAKEITETWKSSKEHYDAIINPDYAVVSYGIFISDGQLYICQVMASKPFVEAYKFDKANSLNVKSTKQCRACKATVRKMNKNKAMIGWYTVSNDSVYYWNTTYVVKPNGKIVKRNLNKIFYGGAQIAFDVIHQLQFDCNGNPSYDNNIYTDGYHIGTIDKTSLKNDMHPSPYYLQIYVGQKPEFPDTFYQVDFHLVKRKKYCLRNMTIYVDPDHFKPQEYFTIPKPKIDVNKSIIIEDSIEVRVNYERNQTSEDTSIFLPLKNTLDSLVLTNHEIQQIHFTGVASIEGDEVSNEKLYKKRGEIISSYIQRYYPNTKIVSDYFENFDEFRAGIIGLGLNDVANYSDDSLRIYANKNKNEKSIENLLNETRYSSVQILFRDIIKIENEAYGFSVQRLQDLIDERNLKELIPLYQVLANKAIEGDNIIADSLLNLNIPEELFFADVHWYHFILELNFLEEPVTAEKLNRLKELKAIPTDADFLEYRILFNVFNRDEAIDVSDFGDIIGEIKSKKQKAWIECLELISGVQSGRYSPHLVAPILLQSVLKMKFNLKQTYFICQYLIEWGYTKEPYLLLSKFAKIPGQFPKLYKQYIKLGYFLGMFEDKKEWKKIQVVFRNLIQLDSEEFCNLFTWEQMGVRALEYKEIAGWFCESCRN